MKRDMSQLYSRLGLRPDCTLDEFKHAYRRRIAELHPDHTKGTARDANTLSELVWLYATASSFHRRHGRLPGAPVTEAPVSADRRSEFLSKTLQAPSTHDTDQDLRITDRPQRSERSLHAASLLLPLSAVVLLIVLSGDWLSPGPRNDSGAPPSFAEHPSPRWLEPGTLEMDVLALQGEPSERHGNRWLYGPSWVQFEDGRVVDWYSAPQRPLMTAVSAIGAEDAKAAAQSPRGK
ncbi:MAG: J domain-containing protein [Thermomonas sp.]